MFAIDIPFYRTAEGRGLEIASRVSRGAAKDSSAAMRLIRLEHHNHGLQPWLHSCAAPRLEINGHRSPLQFKSRHDFRLIYATLLPFQSRNQTFRVLTVDYSALCVG